LIRMVGAAAKAAVAISAVNLIISLIPYAAWGLSYLGGLQLLLVIEGALLFIVGGVEGSLMPYRGEEPPLERSRRAQRERRAIQLLIIGALLLLEGFLLSLLPAHV